MTGMIIRRLIQFPIILLVIYTITFALAWALPGEAVLNDEGRAPPQAVLDAIKAQYDLDNPLRFYFRYLGNITGVHWALEKLKGEEGRPPEHIIEFGPSFRHEDWGVNDLIAGSLPVSVVLGLSAILIALGVGTLAGVAGALKPNSLLDFATLLVALIGISLPSFVIGTVLLVVFPVWLGWGDVGGWGRPQNLILPALTLSLPFAAYIARLTRMGMIEVMGSDYIRTARAKGLPGRAIVIKHGLKNAFLPVLSYLGPAAAFAMTGSFVVEKVFTVPGIGQHFVDAVRSKDLFVIMGVTLVFSGMLVLFNLIVDIAYRWVDPRIE